MPFCHIQLIAQKQRPPGYPRVIETLGDRLKVKRMDEGLLQRDVAEILAVGPNTVLNWEKGYSNPIGARSIYLRAYLEGEG